MTVVDKRDRLSLPDTWAFSAASLPLAALAVTIGVYLSPHYSDQNGIALPIAAVGAAFGIVRQIDMPIDFLLGLAMDRTKTRWGRYRVWTIIGGPITFVAVYMLYFAKPGVGMAYLVTWLLIMYIGTSILTLAHSAWAATLTRTDDERSRLYGIMAAVGVLGSTAVLATPGVLNLIDPSRDVGVRAMGWFILAFVPLSVFLVVWRTPERLAPETKGQRFTLKDYVSLAARPSMGRIIVADFFLSLGPQWTGALYVFFFTDSRGYTRAETMWLLVLYMFAGFFGAPLIARLAMAISKHRTAMLSIAGWGIILASLMLTPSGNIPIGSIQMFALGFLAAGFNVVTRAMTADVADEIRLEQGLERSGLLFAFTTLTTKLAGAMGIFASYQVLGAVNYMSGVENTPEAIQGMVLAYIVVPVVFMIVAALCLWGYPLGKARHADIRRQLEERDASLMMEDTAIAVGNPPSVAPARD